MPDGLVTSRALQNEETGIDLHVPLYQEVRGSMMTGYVEYQIIVVTRLAAFKSSKHKPGDVVQLVVSKKYSEIDQFYYQLCAQHPTVSLPAMPRKALFVGETDIRERRVAFDELVKFISKNSTLATSPEVLEFLGAKSTAADFKSRTVAGLEDPEEEEEEDMHFFQRDVPPAAAAARTVELVRPAHAYEEAGEEEDDDEEQYLGPLGNAKSQRQKPQQPVKPAAPRPSLSLFGEDEPQDEDLFLPAVRDKGNLKLFEDPDLGGAVRLGDSLLLTTATDKAADSGLDEDTDELFRIENDFDKFLRVKKSVQGRPASVPKPALPSRPSLLLATREEGSAGAGPSVVTQVKDQTDILQYIQQNESAASDDLDLFP